MALRAGSAQFWRVELRRFGLVISGVMVAVVLTVLFVPGVRETVERQVLAWLAGMAR